VPMRTLRAVLTKPQLLIGFKLGKVIQLNRGFFCSIFS